MNANELLYWLRGYFELSNEPPTREAWGHIAAAIKYAQPLGYEHFLPPEKTTISELPPFKPNQPCGGCSENK